MKQLIVSGLILALGACNTMSGGDDAPTKDVAVNAGQERVSLSEIPEGTDDGSHQSWATGDVAGIPLKPSTNIFVAGVVQMGAPLPVMALIQSDTPEICRHLQQGTMPKDASLLAAVLLQVDNGPFSTTAPYPSEGHIGRETESYAMGHFRHLDGQCTITPKDDSLAGVSLPIGSVALRQYIPGQRAVADYALALSEDDAFIKGHIDAEFCDAPAFFDDPEIFLNPVPADKCG